MKDRVRLAIPSHPKFLCLVRDLTVRMGRITGIKEEEIEDLKLAVDEACSNVIRHAYKGDTTKRIVVQFKISPRGLEVIIEDSGLKANPELIRGRDLDDLKPGGLGVHFIRRTFDCVEFDPKKQTGNRLRLTKYLKTKYEN
ncbi:MAG: ATP-binding protein [Thermodesulfovibrionales bacterium]